MYKSTKEAYAKGDKLLIYFFEPLYIVSFLFILACASNLAMS